MQTGSLDETQVLNMFVTRDVSKKEKRCFLEICNLISNENLANNIVYTGRLKEYLRLQSCHKVELRGRQRLKNDTKHIVPCPPPPGRLLNNTIWKPYESYRTAIYSAGKCLKRMFKNPATYRTYKNKILMFWPGWRLADLESGPYGWDFLQNPMLMSHMFNSFVQTSKTRKNYPNSKHDTVETCNKTFYDKKSRLSRAGFS